MDVVPIIDIGLGNSSYVVDLGDGSALVVDPERNPSPHLEVAEQRNLRPRFTVETHLHADFVSGSRELIAAGATLLAPAGSDLSFDYRRVDDGEEIDLGGLTLRAIATPGHTPEHLAYLLLDDADPLALFSGGTLMAGGVARTDLVSPGLTEELVRAAYRSIRDRLLTLPDDLDVYPTHGAGSFCSAATTGERTTTIGRERGANPLLQAADEDDFVARLTAGFGSFPSYFLRLREVNRVGPAVYGPTPPAPAPLPPSDVAQMVSAGAEVIDVRAIDRFAAGHIPGSLSIELRDQFATWLGWLVAPDRDLVLVTDPNQDLSEVVRQALKVGYEQIRGVLDGGIDAWVAEGRPLARIGIVAPSHVLSGTSVVDVRQASEWDEGHVPGAIHLELGSVAIHARELTGEVVVYCGHGQRAMTAASLLQRAGGADLAITRAGHEELTRALAATTA